MGFPNEPEERIKIVLKGTINGKNREGEEIESLSVLFQKMQEEVTMSELTSVQVHWKTTEDLDIHHMHPYTL